MESIVFDDADIEVEELARPAGALCRLLKDLSSGDHFLEYVVSSGPYKIDVTHYERLSPEHVRQYEAGTIDLGRMARELEEAAWARGTTWHYETAPAAKLRIKCDLSIPIKFNGPQPNAYGVEPAKSEPVRAGTLIGDTRQGGSVNFERYTFIPHCSGTHTECVGHITHERISVRDCLQDALIPAVLISVTPKQIDGSGDLMIARRDLAAMLPGRPAANGSSPEALIVRTTPNGEGKLTAEYGAHNIPPYFAADAMRFIVERGFTHLLCDLPSIDRIFDDGKLINHRIFWNVGEGSFEVTAETRINSTITELIYIPNEVVNGEYLLNLQIAPFDADCAPSRPLLLEAIA
jgi:arylformamidase